MIKFLMVDIQQLLGPNGLLISKENDKGDVDIYWGGRLFYSFNRFDSLSKKIGIAMLARLGVLQKTICDFFNISRHTIRRILSIYQEQGVNGLVSFKPGPEPVSEELRQFVIKMYLEIKDTYGYQKKILDEIKVKEKEGLFKKSIGRTMLFNIIKSYREETKKGQKENNTPNELENEAAIEKKKKIILPEYMQSELDAELDESKEICVEHGGAAITAQFLDEYGIDDYLPIISNNTNLFSNTELAFTYAMLNAGGIVTVEQEFSHLPRYEMGGIIGRTMLPSLSVYRQRIPQIVDKMNIREAILETSKNMHELLEFSKTVYIDGHFLPYYGKSRTLYDYYPQKRLAMKGREYFFVHDRRGLPVYATISEGYRKMKFYIEDLDKKLRYIYGVKERELLEVFDRGGYSKDFCIRINQSIRFICWKSDGRVIPDISEDSWQEVKVIYQGNEYGEYNEKIFEAFEREVRFELDSISVKFREVWIRKGNKVSPALTNDFTLSLEDVVRNLTRRWGAQENIFKELKAHGIDKIHSYLKADYTPDYLYENGLENKENGIDREVDNPEIGANKKKIKALRLKLKNISSKILDLQEKGKIKQLEAMKQQRNRLDRRIENLKTKNKSLPEKVKLLDKIRDEKIVMLCEDKKLFFDWLKMNAIWAKREIIKIVKPYYKDLRDINKFVQSIMRSRTYIKKHNDILYVNFPRQRSKKKKIVLQKLCEYLNDYEYDFSHGLKVRKMIFGVKSVN